MNGIDGFLGKSSLVLDARVMSTGAKSGDAEGMHEDPGEAAAFGSHLADLSQHGGAAGDSAALGSLPDRTMPAIVQQNFLVTTGAAEMALQTATEPKAGLQAPRSTTTSSQAVSSGVGLVSRKDTFIESVWMRGWETSFADGGSSPIGERPVIEASQDAKPQSHPGTGGAFTMFPLAPDFSAVMAAGEAMLDRSNEMTASSGATIAGAATISDVIQIMPSVAQPAVPQASRVVVRPPRKPSRLHGEGRRRSVSSPGRKHCSASFPLVPQLRLLQIPRPRP